MNLTFQQIEQGKGALIKLVNTTVLTDYKEALAIAKLKVPLEAALEELNKSTNTIVFKYAEKAMKRADVDFPTGYSTPQEEQDQLKEHKKFKGEICTVSFNFIKLKDETVEAMFNDKDKKMKLSGYNLAMFEELGIMGTKKKAGSKKKGADNK